MNALLIPVTSVNAFREMCFQMNGVGDNGNCLSYCKLSVHCIKYIETIQSVCWHSVGGAFVEM